MPDQPDHVSLSQLRMWRRCARQWYYRYALGEVIPPRAALSAGKSVHRGAEAHYRALLAGEPPWKPALAAECTVAAWEEDSEGIDWFTEDTEANQWVTRIVGAAGAHAKHVSSVVQKVAPVIAVEEPFTVEASEAVPMPIVGFIDSLHEHPTEHRLVIRDIKTMLNKRTQRTSSDEDQLSLYAWVVAGNHLVEPESVGAVFDVVTPKTVEAEPVQPTSARVRRLFDDFAAMLNGISAGAFVRCGDGWWCSEKWCGYWPMCQKDG